MSRYPEGTTPEDVARSMLAKRPKPKKKKDRRTNQKEFEARYRETIHEEHAAALQNPWWEKEELR